VHWLILPADFLVRNPLFAIDIAWTFLSDIACLLPLKTSSIFGGETVAWCPVTSYSGVGKGKVTTNPFHINWVHFSCRLVSPVRMARG
jgi:hypothetical protein